MQELCGRAYLSVYILEQSFSTGTIIIIAILKARHDNYHIKCCVWCAPKLTGIMERLNKLGQGNEFATPEQHSLHLSFVGLVRYICDLKRMKFHFANSESDSQR